MNGGMAPMSRSDANAPGGTNIILKFPDTIGEITSNDVKKILAPVLDFEKHSATENYADTLPPEVKQAIAEKKPIEGMDRDQVLLAMGRPLAQISRIERRRGLRRLDLRDTPRPHDFCDVLRA